MDTQKVLLRTEHLVKYFGALKATNDVSLEIYEGEIHAIIGLNGAGKSTLMDEIVNRTHPTKGKVFFEDCEITNRKPFEIANLGLCKCFQISKLFSHLTCYENIQIALIKKHGKVYDFSPRKSNYLQHFHFKLRNKTCSSPAFGGGGTQIHLHNQLELL